jgi:hypothetical protein
MKKKKEHIPTLEEVNDELGSLTSPPKAPPKAQRIRRYDSKGKTVEDRVLCAKHTAPYLAEAKKNKQKIAAVGEFNVSECEQCKIDAYEEDLRYGAHIHVDPKTAECFFRVGDISIRVEGKNPAHNSAPESILRCLNGLLDSQVQQLAQAYELPIHPFVRELLDKPLIGWVQLVWYRDIIKNVSDHVKKQQGDRVEKYRQQLNQYKPDKEAPANGEAKPRKRAEGTGVSRGDLSSRSFKFVAATKDVASGRESDLLEVMKKLKHGTFADIVKAAEGHVTTKQKFDVIIARFLKELIAHKAVEEIK